MGGRSSCDVHCYPCATCENCGCRCVFIVAALVCCDAEIFCIILGLPITFVGHVSASFDLDFHSSSFIVSFVRGYYSIVSAELQAFFCLFLGEKTLQCWWNIHKNRGENFPYHVDVALATVHSRAL